MKKALILLSLLFMIAGCSGTANSSTPKTNTSGDTSNTSSNQNIDPATGLSIDPADGLLMMTADDLAKFDGKNGNKAFVAVDGKVYDVTGDRNWSNGDHYKGMKAGIDLSAYIDQAPHGRQILDQFTVVGKLSQ